MKFLQDNRRLIALFLLTVTASFAQSGDPASNLAVAIRDIVIQISAIIAEIFLAFGVIRAGLNLLRGGIFIGQAILVAIIVTHIPQIVDWAKGLSL